MLARFVLDSLRPVFAMPTSTASRSLYRRYGELQFELGGQPQRLQVYQRLDLLASPAYRDYLFVPFTDRTKTATAPTAAAATSTCAAARSAAGR